MSKDRFPVIYLVKFGGLVEAPSAMLLINDFLSHVNLGERTIKGCLEAYSCKHTGTDKKLSLSLENEIFDYLGKSSDTDSSSPVEYLICRSSRKTLIYLLLALYHMYPDYDFSAVKAHQFFTEENWDSFKQIFDIYMFEASKEWLDTNEGSPLLENLYKTLDEVRYFIDIKRGQKTNMVKLLNVLAMQVVKVAECEIYTYNPEADADPFLERGAINLVGEGLLDDSSFDEDGEIFDGMDMLRSGEWDRRVRWGRLEAGETMRTDHFRAKSVCYTYVFGSGLGDHVSYGLKIDRGLPGRLRSGGVWAVGVVWVVEQAKQRERTLFGLNLCAIAYNFESGIGFGCVMSRKSAVGSQAAEERGSVC
ncbi:putative tetratricopeptide repeat protein 5-like [Capsicum annuum]|nr:putative tetratricopeptide repeat protein 5-like [Capsicum annuum]